jgi:hypothetical protein
MLHLPEQGAECGDVPELFETVLQRVHQGNFTLSL